MRVAIYDRVEQSMPASLPLRLTQACSQRSANARRALINPAARAMVEKSILLCVAPRTSQREADRALELLGQKQIPPSELYRFKGLRPRMPTQPLLEASHA